MIQGLVRVRLDVAMLGPLDTGAVITPGVVVGAKDDAVLSVGIEVAGRPGVIVGDVAGVATVADVLLC